MKINLVLIGFLALSVGCYTGDTLEDNNGPAQIEVTGYLDGSRIKTTLSSPLNPTHPVLLSIVGESHAAPPFATVLAHNPRSDETVETSATANGSFLLHLSVLQGDTLAVSLEGHEPTDSVEIHAENSTPLPPIVVDGIYLNRSLVRSSYIFVGIHLEEPLQEGQLEILNLDTGYREVLFSNQERNGDWFEWLNILQDDDDEDHDTPHDSSPWDHYENLYTLYGGSLQAERGADLLLFYTYRGEYSESLTLQAP
ncbi:MAG: hypothetical protein VX699_12235 [Myxococcota bacterium]|nr:hypothetical protein [Myxococcota bacterium]